METRQVILQLRTAKGLSQEELAAKVYVTRQAVSRWETGLSVPDAGMLVRIAGALDTTVNDLLGEEEPEQGRDLAAELEALNRQLAEREERSRRRWRAFFAAVGILALWGAVMLAAGLIRHSFFPVRRSSAAPTGPPASGSSARRDRGCPCC